MNGEYPNRAAYQRAIRIAGGEIRSLPDQSSFASRAARTRRRRNGESTSYAQADFDSCVPSDRAPAYARLNIQTAVRSNPSSVEGRLTALISGNFFPWTFSTPKSRKR